MTGTTMSENCDLLDGICDACLEIQQSLNKQLETTTSSQYRTDIEKDVVTLENLKLIMVALKKDIESGKVGASAELLLRIAANDFKNKLALIPEKKSLRDLVTSSLKKVHRNILYLTMTETTSGI